ncbi:tail tape measure protein [Novosphingobium sp. TH158]|uniref:tail tape measure protein n=1 Tax=Novosphingobium sp. TH158 TaxID=2067455 RepID=UPI000C7AC03A|nr:tail tape measure protein [Novosphingobium sp. TH158]PLK27415.1 tail tape measure protein [Novosphingobium sp. TH158]
MADTVDTLLVDVRASTQGFAQDIAQMRGTFDGTLLSGFEQAGTVLERGLTTAIRKGTFGFEDLRRISLGIINDIAAQATRTLFDSIGLGGSAGGGGGTLGGLFGGLIGGLLGLPGRAIGGPVSPGKGYVVGERGPELFVPTSAGRIENALGAGGSRDVRIAISVNAPTGPAASQALQRSSRQVASAVRRALREF